MFLKEMMKRISKKFSDNIFMEENNASVSEDRSKYSQSFNGVPYLKKGDSSMYIDQFLGKEEPISPLKSEGNQPQSRPPPIVQEQPKEENDHSERSEKSEGLEQVPEETQMNPSAFHNFQKHLTVALKHAVIFKQEQKTAKDYVKAAARLWRAFSQSKVCTKKVLHFLLGDRNQHQTTNQDLRQFGFSKIYETFGDKIIKEARVFLQREVLRQIKEESCLQVYFQHKKIKDKEKFKKYVAMFVEQLQQGFLRKRLPRVKVAELMRS